MRAVIPYVVAVVVSLRSNKPQLADVSRTIFAKLVYQCFRRARNGTVLQFGGVAADSLDDLLQEKKLMLVDV